MAQARTVFSDEEKAAVVEEVFEGMPEGKTLAQTCKRIGARAGTVRMWIVRDEGWRREYAYLRPMLGAALAEEAIRVARESTTQTTAMDRVLIETLKWASAKSAPAEFGERQVVQHEGGQEMRIRVVEEDGAVVGPAVTARIAASAAVSLPASTDALDD
jgi:transposase-like protein